VSFRGDIRAACVELLTGFAAAQEPPIRLQVYPGRPASVYPPTAFVDRITEGIVFTGPDLMQRTPTAEIVLLHGLFDSKDAVDHADEFTDAFLVYVADRIHAAGTNTTVGITSVEDDPTFVADWIPTPDSRTRNAQGPFFATRFSLEGFASD
jgi:hypothetical protein